MAAVVGLFAGCDEPKNVVVVDIVDSGDAATNNNDTDSSNDTQEKPDPEHSDQEHDDTTGTRPNDNTDQENNSDEPKLVSSIPFQIPTIAATSINPLVSARTTSALETMHRNFESIHTSISTRETLDSASALAHQWSSRIGDDCESVLTEEHNAEPDSIWSEIISEVATLREALHDVEVLIKRFDGKIEADEKAVRLFIPPEYICGARYEDKSLPLNEEDFLVPETELDSLKENLAAFKSCVSGVKSIHPSILMSLSDTTKMSLELSKDKTTIQLATLYLDNEVLHADLYLDGLTTMQKAAAEALDADMLLLSGHLGVTLDVSEDIGLSIHSEDGIYARVLPYVSLDIPAFRFVATAKQSSILSSIDFGGTALSIAPELSCWVMEFFFGLDTGKSSTCMTEEKNNSDKPIVPGLELRLGSVSFGVSLAEDRLDISDLNMDTLASLSFGGLPFFSAKGRVAGKTTGITNRNIYFERVDTEDIASALRYHVDGSLGLRWLLDLKRVAEMQHFANPNSVKSTTTEFLFLDPEENSFLTPLPACPHHDISDSPRIPNDQPADAVISITRKMESGAYYMRNRVDGEGSVAPVIVKAGECLQRTTYLKPVDDDTQEQQPTAYKAVTCPESYLAP